MRAAARLDHLIEQTPAQADSSRPAVQARAEFRMSRLLRFLSFLGNPHLGYPIVHIGGTSGKGSTSTAVASILTAAGYRTGLHISPYLQVATEKLQIDRQLIAADTFVRLSEELLDALDRWRSSGNERLTYGEAWIALMTLFFRDQQVDVAVVEVGAGGRFDLTNILTPVLSVITSVGIDHTNTLGSTIEAIAWHKAGIIKHGIPAISAVSSASARRIMADEATAVGTTLTQLDLVTQTRDIRVEQAQTTWVDLETSESHAISLAGSFQAINGGLAVHVARQLRSTRFEIPDTAIAAGLAQTHIPGRVEFVPDRVPVLLDGAHNHDKIAALAQDIPALLPVEGNGRRIAVVGALEAKQADDMLALLVPSIDMVIATSPQVLAKSTREASALAEAATLAGFGNAVVVEPDPQRAIGRALQEARAEDVVLVTGSLYLVGNIRERWYRSEDIVETQSSWPTRSLDT